MPTVTAKVICNFKSANGEGDNRSARVTFAPDYTDGRNKEWSLATPTLTLEMLLRGDVADRFATGQRYTLSFQLDDPEADPHGNGGG